MENIKTIIKIIIIKWKYNCNFYLIQQHIEKEINYMGNDDVKMEFEFWMRIHFKLLFFGIDFFDSWNGVIINMGTENEHSDEDIESHGVSFDKKRRISGAILGPLCAIILWFLPIQGLSDPAHHLLAIMTLVSIWWITEPVPIPVT